MKLDGSVRMVTVETEAEAFRASRPKLLFQGPFINPPDGHRYYDLAPEGERFVMLQGTLDDVSTGPEHLRIVLNWFDELDSTFAGTTK